MKEVKQNIDELIAQAKIDFPVGCRYKCPNTGRIHTLDLLGDTYNIYGDGHINAGAQQGYLYYYGKWATLVSYPEGYIKPEQIITEYQIY